MSSGVPSPVGQALYVSGEVFQLVLDRAKIQDHPSPPHRSIRLSVTSLIPPWRGSGKGVSQPQAPPPFLTLPYGCVPPIVASKDPLLLDEGPAGLPPEQGHASSPLNWESQRRLRNSQGCGHKSSKNHGVSGTLLVSHVSCPGPR